MASPNPLIIPPAIKIRKWCIKHMRINLFIFLNVLFLLTSNNIASIHGYDKNDTNMFENMYDNLKDRVINLTKSIEYTVDINANQIFPNNTIKNAVLYNNEPVDYLIPILEYNLLGFDIFATDIKVRTISKSYANDIDKLKIDFPIMEAKNVNVKNKILDLNYENIDLSSTYTIYDSKLDKFTIHIPIHVAARYLPK